MERLTLPVTLISSISDIYLLLVSDNHDHRISVQKTSDDMYVLGTLPYKFIQEGIKKNLNLFLSPGKMKVLPTLVRSIRKS